MLIRHANMNPKTVHLVWTALNNPKYQWRTIDGIEKETGLSRASILVAMSKLKHLIVQSRNTNPNGDNLYTSKENYKKKASTKDRIIAAFSNRSR